MSKRSIATVAPGRLRAARRELLETGELRLHLPDPDLSRSWLRSHAAGLSPVGRAPGAPHASSAQLKRALERHHELVAHARPVMQDLFAQTRDSDSLVILSDGQGLLLQALGEGRFVDRAERVALRPGAIWDERWRGTNAIGCALVERRPVAVMGGEHYLERNGFLSCTAAPIRDPQGRVLGVLDISGDQRSFHRHTLALVRMAARAVEHRLFHTRHADALRLQLHEQREGLGTTGEGLLAVSEEGWVIGANETALSWLGAEAERSPRLDALLPVEWAALLGWACAEQDEPRMLRRDGEPALLWMRAVVPAAWRRRVSGGGVSASGPGDEAGMLSRALCLASSRVEVQRDESQAVDAAGAARAARAAETAEAAEAANTANTANPANPAIAANTQIAANTGNAVNAMNTAEGQPTPLPPPLAALDLGDPAVHHQLRQLHKVLDKPIALLLQGESGVGKDVLARAVHDSGARRTRPYVAVNCAALPEGLIEAELFGYRGGAFTGASRDGATGRLRQAHGGTLFLDEIGDMPLSLQARLLRVLQDRQVQPLGGGAAVTVDVQLICASHRPLRAMVEQGRFREDLYYRVNGLSVTVPPLRARTDLRAIVARLLRDSAGREVTVSPAVMAEMERFPWPGNIRQLEQALRVAEAMLEPWDTEIQFEHLPEDLRLSLASVMAAGAVPLEPFAPSACYSALTAASTSGALARPAVSAMSDVSDSLPRPSDALPDALRPHTQAHARRVLADCDGNVSEAARRLGIGRNTLYRMLR